MRFRGFVPVLSWLFACALALPAGALPVQNAVQLRSGAVEPPATDVARLDLDPAAARIAVVRFPGPATTEQLRSLEAAVERVYTYLPDHAFLVKLPPGQNLAVGGGEIVRAAVGAAWVAPYTPELKIAPPLARLTTSAEAAHPDESERPRMVLIHVYPDVDLDAFVARLRSELHLPGIVGHAARDRFSRVRALLTPAEVVAHRDALARLPEVFWVDLEGRRVLLNDTTIWVGQSGTGGGGATPIFDQGIFGEGQIVGVLDTGIDPDMCYFRDPALGLPPVNACNGGTVVDLNQRKVVAVNFLWSNECNGGISSTEWDTHDHGSHVAGTVAGDDFANPLTHDPGDGMAPGAQLVIQDCGFQTDNCADCPGIGCPVVDLNPIFQQAFDQGARIHTNSWGDRENFSPQNVYSAGSEDADEFMWSHKDFLLLFAAGNQGPGSGTVGSPSTAKNVISVGATQRGTSSESMASFSSCGPTDDGRIKPDLTIPGQSIVSANNDGSATSNNCGTRTMSGTSMASPGAAGFAALARQYYDDGFYPSGTATPADAFTPTAALVKATLLNSTTEMANAGFIPANCQGWGRILLDDSLHFAGETRRLIVDDDRTGFVSGSSGESRDSTVLVGSSESLRATLVWTDFPSTPAASTHLVNDLDLVVTGPGGTFLGNVFSGGQSVTGGAADRLNTVEQVFLPTPTAGTYTVSVRSHTVPQGPQPYALVVSGDVAQDTGGPCTFAPSFGGLGSAVDAEVSSCGIDLAWSAATSNCPEFPDVTYTVYRSTTPGFTPGASNQIATCLTGTSFTDTNVVFGADYHYVVRAEDSATGGSGPCNGGNADANTSEASATPSGGRSTLHATDFESGDGGWVNGADTCTTGAWTTGDPDFVSSSGVVTQPEDDHTPAPGVNAAFTQPNAGGAGSDDVDGGMCEALSPVVDASAFGAAEVSLWWYHGQRDPGDDPSGDFFRVDLSNDGGSSFPTSLVSLGDDTSNAAWAEARVRVTSPGLLRIRTQASDGPSAGDLVEGGLDDVLVEGLFSCGAGQPCSTPPSFGGAAGASDDETSTCGVTVSWNAATSGCAENPDVTYTVYRSTTSGFTPGAGNQLATCVSGTSFTDVTAQFGTTYFYVVRAEDSGTSGSGACNGGNADSNTAQVSASPTGGRTILHQVDFESGAGGWAHSAADSTCSTGDWVVGNPNGVSNGGTITQLEDDHTPAPGVNALFTQPNSNAGIDDVDGGVCTGLSPTVDASGFASASVSLWIYHGQRDAGDDPSGDFFRVDLSNDGGASFPTSLFFEGDIESNASWTEVAGTIQNPGQLRLRIQASDGSGAGDLVEGGLDDVVIEGTAACTAP